MSRKPTQSFLSDKIPMPEVFIGVVSAVGADVGSVVSALRQAFEEKEYAVSHIKISSIMQELAPFVPSQHLETSSKLRRINSHIDFGNEVRRRVGNDILAAFAIQKINEARFSGGVDHDFASRVYIIDQLKTVEELELLRQVYGRGFFQVSVYSARDVRVDNLARASAHDHLTGDRNRYRHKCEKVVLRDEDERKNPHGQKVGRIFQLADFVVNADKIGETDNVSRQVGRFVDLLFGANSYSPTRAEYGMYLAHSAALRSLDLSRQVGAAIFLASGEVAALGSNEVPRAGGGTYWADDELDGREFTLKVDSNDNRKHELLNEVVSIALGRGRVLGERKRERLEDSQFMDALEYGRIVHAEMSAISDAARTGRSIGGSTLYCTTFPCHMCSKHIVAAGIKRVVFLEPYPKSLTADLHSDSVRIEGTSRGVYESFNAVDFVPFYGITPRRYREMFQRTKRKKDSKFLPYQDIINGKPSPIFTIIVPWYASRETEIMRRIAEVPRYLLDYEATT
jgi:deoxycytidylate deaminase